MARAQHTTARRLARERGLATLDVLIGIAIFGLVAVIAVTAWRQYHVRAYETAAISDAKAVGDGILAAQVDGWAGPAAAHLDSDAGELRLVAVTKPRLDVSKVSDPLATSGANLTAGNRLTDWTVINKENFGFCIEHLSGGSVDAWAAYRTDRGGVYAHGRSDGCPGIAVETPEGGDEPGDEPGDHTPPTDPPTPGPTDLPDPPTPDPTDEPAEDPTDDPTQDPVGRDWPDPQSAQDIEDLCRDLASDPRAIVSNGSVIYGTDGDDIIIGGNGGQTIYGLGGDDLLCGGNGKDTIYGGAGNDILMGGNGKDTLYGGTGADFLHGNNGKDTMYVGDGHQDVAYGGNGKDIYLEDGPDGPESPLDEDEFIEDGTNG